VSLKWVVRRRCRLSPRTRRVCGDHVLVTCLFLDSLRVPCKKYFLFFILKSVLDQTSTWHMSGEGKGTQSAGLCWWAESTWIAYKFQASQPVSPSCMRMRYACDTAALLSECLLDLHLSKCTWTQSGSAQCTRTQSDTEHQCTSTLHGMTCLWWVHFNYCHWHGWSLCPPVGTICPWVDFEAAVLPSCTNMRPCIQLPLRRVPL